MRGVRGPVRRQGEAAVTPVMGRLHPTGDLIVMSRLLVLQSKRLLIASCTNKLRATGDDRFRRRLASLQTDSETALSEYRRAVLDWAAPETAQYWLVAHQTMIEGAEELVTHMRASADELPQPDRGDIGDDIVRLEAIIERWRGSMVATRSAELNASPG